MNNTKMSLTTLIAAATLAVSGLAMAQSNPPTSTAGAGCTATANAMKGGNLGSSPTGVDCTTAGAKTAAAPAAVTTRTTESAASTPSTTMSGSSATVMSDSDTKVARAPVRMARAARADRN